MSDTPEFDALVGAKHADHMEISDPIAKFARRMERERDAAKQALWTLGVQIAEKRLIGYREFGMRLAAAERERDAYRDAYQIAYPAISQPDIARKCRQILAKLGEKETA